MASIFSDDEKAQLAELLDMVHDTWARPIVVYSEAKKVVISTDPNFNGLYGRNVSNVEVEPVLHTIDARIQYGSSQEVDSVNEAGLDFQTKVYLPIGWVRLKVKIDGYELLKDAERVEFDGRVFTQLSSNRPHGLFTPTYYTFLLKPVKAES